MKLWLQEQKGGALTFGPLYEIIPGNLPRRINDIDLWHVFALDSILTYYGTLQEQLICRTLKWDGGASSGLPKVIFLAVAEGEGGKTSAL